MALHLDVPTTECIARVTRQGSHLQASTADEAADAVASQARLLEAPTEREGFKAVVRLKGSLAAAQDLVRRWTQEMPEEEHRQLHHANVEDEDAEAPAPPLPRLKDWIEVEEQGGCRS